MTDEAEINDEARKIAERWCAREGPSWSVQNHLGTGGTAPVFEISSPAGLRALKINSVEFSAGKKGEIERRRIQQQLTLKEHDCPSLVQIYDGGNFEDRLWLLMGRAPGRELATRLADVPRNKVRHVVDQVARAAIFLRGRGFSHRDIKSPNIFVTDDFDQVTLLDISVIRDIHDPVGLGTDQDGQLPVVATARYSPTEYLFRLLPSTAELWHALDVYQLGGLLHDLIARQMLFEDEFQQSKANRYRFAWIVATEIPPVDAEDVDKDLLFTARRALDKDWQRRSSLRLEDFLADALTQRRHALNALGLSGPQGNLREATSASINFGHIAEIASQIGDTLAERLRIQNAATATHSVRDSHDDGSKTIELEWEAPTGSPISGPIQLLVSINGQIRGEKVVFRNSISISALVNGNRRSSTLDLPDVDDGPDAAVRLADQSEQTLGHLAADITKSN